jgi:Tfp pilus assembly protein PilW
VLSVARRWRRIARDERGFTLPELLIATVLGMAVIGAAAMFFTGGIKNQPRISTRAEQIQRARVTMDRIVRELRQGSTAPTAGATQLSLITYVHRASCGGAPARNSIQCRVSYSCSSGACTRIEALPDGSSPGPAVQVVSGLSTSSVFAYTAPTSTVPGYVGVTLAFPTSGGDDAITLSDGTALRNPSS